MQEVDSIHAAIKSFVDRCSVPIVCDYTSQKTGTRKAGTIGTGTLFSFSQKYFLVTAGHVIADIDSIKDFVGIPIGNLNADILTFDGCRFSYPSDKEVRKKFDVGIVELSDEHVSQLKKSFHFLSGQNIDLKLRSPNLLVSGFPFTYSKFDSAVEMVVGKPFRLMSRPKEPEAKDFEFYDPKIHVLVEYSDVLYADGEESGKAKSESDLGGISGCAIWNYTDHAEGLWSIEKNLRVVGIQSTKLANEWLKGVRWNAVFAAFEKTYPEIAEELKGQIRA